MFIDTHTHLYDPQFDEDRDVIIARAMENNVGKMLLPNCDLGTVQSMMNMVEKWPDQCYPMLGLHPCYVGEQFQNDLNSLEKLLIQHQFCAIGEIGLDFHWDVTFIEQQKSAFQQQIIWALNLQLPIAIHTRKSIPESISIVRHHQNGNLKGVFHCFSGTLEEAKEIIDLGFYLGIGGVVTFKNGGINNIIKEIDLKHLILETDAPYLAPVPYRGKRNESAYIPIIAQKIADLKEINLEKVEQQTTLNAIDLFPIK